VAFSHLRRDLQERNGLGEPPGALIGQSDIVHTEKRIAMVRTEPSLVQFVHFFEEWHGLV
jgi:hypothetical protein